MPHAFGLVVHVQRKCETRIKKGMEKCSLKEFEDLWVWSFLKTAVHFLCFASHCSSLSYSSSLPQTSRSGSCIFTASLSSLLFSCQSLSSFFLTCHNFLTMRLVASPTTALRTINLCQCTQLCVNRVFQLHS